MAVGTTEGTIRWMTPRDGEKVLEIQEKVFGRAWSSSRFSDWLNKRSTVGKIILLGERLAGYVLYELAGRRIRIVELAIDPACRRQGLATRLIERLKDHLRGERRELLVIKVPEENLAAQLFLRQSGFRATQLQSTAGDSGLIKFEFGSLEGAPRSAGTVKQRRPLVGQTAVSIPMVAARGD